MKNILARSFVLVLVVAGFTASSVSSAAATKHVATSAPTGIVGTPTPMCPFNDKNGCGIY